MLTKVEKVAPQSIVPQGNVLVVQDELLPLERISKTTVERIRTIEIVKMEVAFQHTLMPEQRENFIRPKRHDFL